MHYAHIDIDNNRLLGWYDLQGAKKEGIFEKCIPVEYDVWQEALMMGANCYQNGKFFRVEEILSEEEELERIRIRRDRALSEVDIYQGVLRYEELTDIQKNDLKKYRQALLDAPETMVLPDKPNWMN
jgi:cation diffusion facilitator CzcD-associated flavoprotein CzcO